MEQEVDIVTIDQKEYAIIKEIKINDTTYIYLSNLVDSEDVMIRKYDKNNRDLIIPLESDAEFDIACATFYREEGI